MISRVGFDVILSLSLLILIRYSLLLVFFSLPWSPSASLQSHVVLSGDTLSGQLPLKHKHIHCT